MAICRCETTPMGSKESLLRLRGCGGREKSGSNRYHMVPLSRFGPRGCVKPYSCFGGLYICVLELAMGREELQKAESSSWSPRASFYRKGLPQWHTGGGKGTVMRGYPSHYM